MRRWLLAFMLMIAAGTGATAGGGDEGKPVPEVDIFGGPPLCC